ncbi:SUF system FeS cluster assembly [Macleaya cordata]|uniref:SUF system FeS cluster assembly n=1 Tax=Macleaya cordata TaxID=56857 RepID=A0A200QER5_MACCD|nr:SUF system FeS cluster assembly [Macleaya cordata]
MASSSTFPPPCRLPHFTPKSISSSKPRTKTKFPVRPISTPRASFSDPFVIQIAETLEDSNSTLSSKQSPPLDKLRETSSQSLLSKSWPSRKDERFRFTDTSFIKRSQIHPVLNPPNSESNLIDISSDIPQSPNLVIVDGYIVPSLSKISELPENVYVGSISDISSVEIMEKVTKFVSDFQEGDLFWSLNGIGAPDATVVFVPSGCHVEKPLSFRFYSSESGDTESTHLPMSNPRVLILVEKGGEIGIIEEHLSGNEEEEKCYWENSVMEVFIGEGGKVTHSYIQQQAANAAHIKWTYVQQESSSTYELVEISSGGKLGRHNLHIQQVGPDTVTEVSTFQLCVRAQTQDLHSRIFLQHPRGTTRQLHKCIVAHSLGQVVFDGNVELIRPAQETDANQLSRSLLLEPGATVNVVPNLQIKPDGVQCSHGATICGLDEEDEQLFYLLARGIDTKTARKALLFAFGAEVTERLPCESLRKKVDSHIQRLLEPIA